MDKYEKIRIILDLLSLIIESSVNKEFDKVIALKNRLVDVLEDLL